MIKILTYVFFTCLAIVGLVFASLNPNPVEVNYIFAVLTMPLSVLLVVTLGLGMLLGLITSMALYIRLKREIYQLKGHIKIAQKEVENLRTLPLNETH